MKYLATFLIITFMLFSVLSSSRVDAFSMFQVQYQAHGFGYQMSYSSSLQAVFPPTVSPWFGLWAPPIPLGIEFMPPILPPIYSGMFGHWFSYSYLEAYSFGFWGGNITLATAVFDILNLITGGQEPSWIGAATEGINDPVIPGGQDNGQGISLEGALMGNAGASSGPAAVVPTPVPDGSIADTGYRMQPLPTDVTDEQWELAEKIEGFFEIAVDRNLISVDRLMRFRDAISEGSGKSEMDYVSSRLNGYLPKASSASDRSAVQEAINGLKNLQKPLAEAQARVDQNEPALEELELAQSPADTADGRALISHLRKNGINVGGDYEDLVYTALRIANRRVKTDAELSRVIYDSRERGGNVTDLLDVLGYQSPETIVSLFDQTGISFLGYSSADLGEMGKVFLAQSRQRFLSRKTSDGLVRHKVVSVVAPFRSKPDDNQYINALKAVRMWGLSHGPAANASEKVWLRVLLHEMSHGIDCQLLSLDMTPTALGRRWLNVSWEGWSSGQPPRPKGNNFVDSNGDGRLNADDYSRTNPAEDFAEAFSFWITATGTQRSNVERTLGSEKTAILKLITGPSDNLQTALSR
jgi:hypothetical protein